MVATLQNTSCWKFVSTEKSWIASQYQQNILCAQRRIRSAWESVQSDQRLRCPQDETLGPYLPIERTAKTLIRLGGWPGWSESSLGPYVIFSVLSWGGSNKYAPLLMQTFLHLWMLCPWYSGPEHLDDQWNRGRLVLIDNHLDQL